MSLCRAAYESYRAEFIKEPELVKRLRQPAPSSPSSSPEEDVGQVRSLSCSKSIPADSLPQRPSSFSSPQGGVSLAPLHSLSSSSSTTTGSSPPPPRGSLVSPDGRGEEQTASVSSSSSSMCSPSGTPGEGRGSRRSLSRQELVESLISSSSSFSSPSLSLQKKKDLSDFREKLFCEKDDEDEEGRRRTRRSRVFQESSSSSSSSSLSSSSSSLFRDDEKLHIGSRDASSFSSSFSQHPTALLSSPLFPPSTASRLLSRVSPGDEEELSPPFKRQDEEEKAKAGSDPLQQAAGCQSLGTKKKSEEERERRKNGSLRLPQGGRDLLRGSTASSSSSSTVALQLQSVHDHVC